MKSQNEIIHNPKSKPEVLESFAATNESKPSKMVLLLASEIQSAGFGQAHSNTSPNFMLGVSWSWVFALPSLFFNLSPKFLHFFPSRTKQSQVVTGLLLGNISIWICIGGNNLTGPGNVSQWYSTCLHSWAMTAGKQKTSSKTNF